LTAPMRRSRIVVTVLYFVVCGFGIVFLQDIGLPPFYQLLAGIVMFGSSIALWFRLQHWAKKKMGLPTSEVVIDPLRALDEKPPASTPPPPAPPMKVPEAPTVMMADIEQQPVVNYVPTPPRADKNEKMIKVRWPRTQTLEGYLPVEAVKVVEQEDGPVEVVKEEK